jgi:hypothetical protein
MSLFELAVSEDGHTGSTALDLPDAPMPFTLHIFGRETVAKWQAANEGSRSHTAIAVMTDLRTLARMSGLEWDSAEACSTFNRFCAAQGITEYAVEFNGWPEGY